MQPPPTVSRRVVPDTRRRDILIAVAVGVLVLGFVLYAVLSLGRQANSTGGTEGIIVGKEFVARPETQITVGQGGVHSRKLAGDCLFRVKVPQENGEVYTVFVDPLVYDAQRVGNRFYFIKPKESSSR